MELLDNLLKQFGSQVSLEETEPNIFRLYAPVFHEDGDMYSIYFDTTEDQLIIRDFGDTLMRVSYTYDIRTARQRKILSDIVAANRGELDDGELLVRANMSQASQALMQYTQLVSKVSDIDILRQENVKSLFYEQLDNLIEARFTDLHIEKNVTPLRDKDLKADYSIPHKRPLYIFGVLEDSKAAKVVITCLNFQAQRVPFRSLVVYENFESLSTFNRNQLTNTVGKQYTTLEDFRAQGEQYISDELLA